MDENLNKSNLFDDIASKFPFALNVFNDWYAKYKIAANLEKVLSPVFAQNFKPGTTGGPKNFIGRRHPKFYELPYEFQFGIMLRFMCDIFPENKDQFIMIPEMIELLKTCFEAIEKENLTIINN